MGHYNTAQTTKFTFVLKPQMGVMVLHLLNEPSYSLWLVVYLTSILIWIVCKNIRFLDEYLNEEVEFWFYDFYKLFHITWIFTLVFLCYVKYLNMSYECAWGWHDRYDIYVHIKFKCAAHKFSGRVIQSTGNGMGTFEQEKITLIAWKEWQNCKAEKML